MKSLTRIAAAGILAAGLTLAAVVPANADPVEVTGVASCSNGQYTVQWTINNSAAIYDYALPQVVSPTTSRINYAPYLHGYPMSFTQSQIPGTSGTAEVSLAEFTRGTYVTTLRGEVSLPRCVAPSSIHKAVVKKVSHPKARR